MKPEPIIIHCPQCGDALSVPIRVQSATVYQSSVTVNVIADSPQHHCGAS